MLSRENLDPAESDFPSRRSVTIVPVAHFRLPMQGTEWQPVTEAGTPRVTLN
jgi:hypothetical protein